MRAKNRDERMTNEEMNWLLIAFYHYYHSKSHSRWLSFVVKCTLICDDVGTRSRNNHVFIHKENLITYDKSNAEIFQTYLSKAEVNHT